MECLKISFKELTCLGYYILRHTRDHKGYKPFPRPLPNISPSRPPLLSFNHMKCKHTPIPSHLPTVSLPFTKPQLLLVSLLPCELGSLIWKSPKRPEPPCILQDFFMLKDLLLPGNNPSQAREHPIHYLLYPGDRGVPGTEIVTAYSLLCWHLDIM